MHAVHRCGLLLQMVCVSVSHNHELETTRLGMVELCAKILRYDTRCYFKVRSKADMNRLIYRMETTTKNCKTEKLKSKSRYVRSNSKSLGNHVVSSEKKKNFVHCF